MREANKYLLFIVFLALYCCKEEPKSRKEDDSSIRSRYYNLQNAGWKSTVYAQKVGDITFSATEVPILYYLLKDQGSGNLPQVDSLYEQNKRDRIFEFTFAQDDEKDILANEFTGMSYTDGVKYMSFALDKDFYAVTSKFDTIHCTGVNFERSYKIAPYQKVMLFFSGIDPNEKLQLVYDDFLFKRGTLKFKFKDTYSKIAL
ncbi:MAG: hypothetical protein EOP48_16260 [Sphingobacteriales bacterium]|nr:MAG: hypothetical protein EOP48_16260 [Sphingobacteriales bacterium]